jgi:acyl-CoA thioester hydrolase
VADRSGNVSRHHETTVRVRYAETDQMGVVYYANYMVWMEVGRVEFCRALGVAYRDMEQQDKILLTVAEVNCRYLSPAFYDEEVIIKTWLEKSHPRMVTFAYEMRRASDAGALSSGYSKHIFCGPGLKPVRLPQKYWPYFGIGVQASD